MENIRNQTDFVINLYDVLPYQSNIPQASLYSIKIGQKKHNADDYPLCIYYNEKTITDQSSLVQIAAQHCAHEGWQKITHSDTHITLISSYGPQYNYKWSANNSGPYGYCNRSFIEKYLQPSISFETVVADPAAPLQFIEVIEKLYFMLHMLKKINRYLSCIETSMTAFGSSLSDTHKAQFLSSAQCFFRIWMENEGIRCGLTKDQVAKETEAKVIFETIFNRLEQKISYSTLYTFITTDILNMLSVQTETYVPLNDEK